MNFLQFVLLGLGTGSLYALISSGLVVIYRGSGVINLAQGAMVMVGAYAYYQTSVLWDQSAVVGVFAATLTGALLGVVVQLLVVGRLRDLSPLMRVVATLAVLLVLEAIAGLVYGVEALAVSSFLPNNSIRLASGLAIDQERLILFVIGAAGIAALWWFYRTTHFGRMTAAVAENEVVVRSLGYSPSFIATINWAVGCGLGAGAGALIAPTVTLQPTQLVQLMIPALVVGLVARFRSFPILFAAAMALGVTESVMARYVADPGTTQAVALIAALMVPVLSGRGIPLRSFIADALPSVGTARISFAGTAVSVVGLCIAVGLTPLVWTSGLTQTIGVAVICLSVVLVTGYAGQLSLAQYVLAGFGGLVTARVFVDVGWPFSLSVVAGILATAAVGIVIGIAALRTRGMTLAIVTLASGLVLYRLVLVNGSLNGGPFGIRVESLSVLGISINPLFEPQRYGLFAAVCLIMVSVSLLNLRRGRTGRRLLAVRSNERASAALGISIMGAKLYAFSLGAAIAGLGGTILAFRNVVVQPEQFTTFVSITIVGITVIGGVGHVGGGLMGATLAAGGVGSVLLGQWQELDIWLPLISGLLLLIVLLTQPSGLWPVHVELAKELGRKVRRRKPILHGVEDPTSSARAKPAELLSVEPQVLAVADLSVHFGGVAALSSVNLSVRPGEIHGLIGPNGAGKTTLIDGVTGFVTCQTGTVVLGETEVSKRSPADRANAGIARSFQSLELFEDLSVEENLAVAADSWAAWRYLSDLAAPGRMQLSDEALAIAVSLGLNERLSLRPSELSMGDRKLVSIARALMKRPSVLLLDEPAAGLSDGESHVLGRALRDLADSMAIGVLLVEHNVDMVVNTCDVITVLEEGSILATGTPDEIKSNERVLVAYLGEPKAGESEPEEAPQR